MSNRTPAHSVLICTLSAKSSSSVWEIKGGVELVALPYLYILQVKSFSLTYTDPKLYLEYNRSNLNFYHYEI